jgi:hypothetical protein
MAAKTPTQSRTIPLDGGLVLSQYYFADIDSSDTFASGISTASGAFFLGSEPIEVSQSSGTFTFDAGTNATGWLNVISMGY